MNLLNRLFSFIPKNRTWGQRLSRFLSFCLLAVTALATIATFASSLHAEERAGHIYGKPPCVTLNGIETDRFFSIIFWLAIFVFITTQGSYIYYLVKYRRRKGVKAHYSHGNNALEIVWTTLPTIIFLGLAIYSNRVWYNIHRPAPADAINIEVVAYQFAWDFRYPGPSGNLARSDVNKITTENKFGLDFTDPKAAQDFSTTEMVIPVGRPIHIFLRSRDVIHSFYVPQFRIYQDAVPGRTVGWVWFQTTRTGNFQLACNQLCGKGHYNMKAPLRVVSQEEYDKWYQSKVAHPNLMPAAPTPSISATKNTTVPSADTTTTVTGTTTTAVAPTSS